MEEISITRENKKIIKKTNKDNKKLTKDKKEKQKKKIKDEDFQIPLFSDYLNIEKTNYSVKQLKQICKYYNLSIKGLKKELEDKIQLFFYQSFYCIKIQRKWRKHIWKKIKLYSGPGLINKESCINSSDFFTMDELTSLPFTQFISIKDKKGLIYGFDIASLYTLYKKGKKPYENPYTREIFDDSIFKQLDNLIKLLKLVKCSPILDYKEDDNITLNKQLELRCLSLFQYMDELGNYTNYNWFWELERQGIIRFIRELVDIWEYRAQLSMNTKIEICPPEGKPFININIYDIQTLDKERLRILGLNIIETFIKSGINEGNKALGCNYILCALTLVNEDASLALPWLYASVV